jgi:hypothetical protein
MNSVVGGTDMIFETTPQGFSVGPLLDAVSEVWPDGLFQDAAGEEVRPLTDAQDVDDVREFFVYKDRSSADSWGKEGWTEQHSSEMVHFLIEEDAAHPAILRLTLVIGSETGETLQLITAVHDALKQMAADVPALRKLPHRVNWEGDLRAVGYTSGKEQFYEKVEELQNTLYPNWTADELACHPHEALQFCEVVRRVVAPVPDHLVMKALLNSRKQRKKGATSFEPRLVSFRP